MDSFDAEKRRTNSCGNFKSCLKNFKLKTKIPNLHNKIDNSFNPDIKTSHLSRRPYDWFESERI